MNSPGVPPGTRAKTSSCASLFLLLVSACSLNNPGVDPPAGALSYPAAMAFRDPTATNHRVLYVANSNFDLRYNAGSVQAYDLAKLEQAIDSERCREMGLVDELPAPWDGGVQDAGAPPMVEDAGGALSDDVPLPPDYETGAANRGAIGILCDEGDGERSPCCFDKGERFLLGGKSKSEIRIDSFASAIAVSPDGGRLYVPVRSRDRLLYLDIDAAGQLSCGGEDGRCRRGTVASDKDKDPLSEFAPQPTALAVGALDTIVEGSPKGTFLATAHENGSVGFFVDTGDGPVLHSTSSALDGRLSAVRADPRNRVFYFTSAVRSNRVARFGLRELEDRYAWVPSPALLLDDVAGAFDTRDLLLDENDPDRLYVLMRGVAQSVLFLRLDSKDANRVKLEGEARVPGGPSRLAQATFGGRRVLLVSCFDQRTIYVIDEQSRAPLRVIRGLAGPFEMLPDEARDFLYVADFSVSVLRVIDMRGVFDIRQPPPRIVATLGKVIEPEGLQ